MKDFITIYSLGTPFLSKNDNSPYLDHTDILDKLPAKTQFCHNGDWEIGICIYMHNCTYIEYIKATTISRFLPGVSLKEKGNKSDRLDGDSQLIRVYPAVAAVALRTLAGEQQDL